MPHSQLTRKPSVAITDLGSWGHVLPNLSAPDVGYPIPKQSKYNRIEDKRTRSRLAQRVGSSMSEVRGAAVVPHTRRRTSAYPSVNVLCSVSVLMLLHPGYRLALWPRSHQEAIRRFGERLVDGGVASRGMGGPVVGKFADGQLGRLRPLPAY